MKQKNIFRRYIAVSIFIALTVFFTGCKKSGAFKENAMDDIESISYSVLKRLEPITIIFKDDVKYPENIEKAFKLNPAVKGKWELSASNQVSFLPEEPYDFKTELILNADVGLLQENKANTKGLIKTFSISQPEFNLISSNLFPDEKRDNFFIFEGIGETDIPMTEEDVKKILSAYLESDSNKTPVNCIVSQGSSSYTYKILIKDIKRKKSFQNLVIEWKLEYAENAGGSKSFNVAPESVFQVTAFNKESDSVVEISFSDAIDPAQDLRGFIKIFSDTKFFFNHSVDGHKLKIFCQNSTWADDTKIEILKGIKNIKGKTLKDNASFSIKIAWEKPEIFFTKGGNIIPSKNDARILVSTKNIKGLSIEAFHIYDKNMLQFLQVNNLSGNSQLNRVGDPVWRQSFDFDWDVSMKNRYVVRELDLNRLIKKFPGGMLELRIGFAKKHSMYEPPSKLYDFSNLPFPKDITELEDFKTVEDDYWESAELTEDQRYDFWNQRNNPSHPAYYIPSYNRNCVVSKNVIVSDIGLSVKKDRDNNLYIAAADIISGKPISGADVKLFSFSQKELESGKTDAQGLLMLKNEKKAYFVQAEKNGMYNRIVITDYGTLSTSHFDVAGERAEKGIKGYIYGERGIWRPGDNIHLVFILQDLEKTLPKDFPINFTLEDPLGKKSDYKVFTSSVDGFYKIDTKTAADSKTGNWTARVNAGGKTWSKTIKVETIVPNRLFVNLKTGGNYLTEGNNYVTLNGQWLHGAKASGLKADITARFILDRNPFEKYKNYNFINPEIRVKTDQNEIWDGYLDSDGNAEINIDLDTGSEAPGKLKAVFETRIYEPSGAFSSENRVLNYSPYTRYAGMEIPKSDDIYRDMLYTNREQNLKFAVLDPDGNLVKQSIDLTVKLYKLEWFWWWEADDDSANYTTSRNTRLIKSWNIKTEGGKAEHKIKIDDGEWGRYLIAVYDKDGGHSSAQIVYFDWEGWANRKTSNDDSASMLMVNSGKTKYYADETAEVTFPCYEGAKALITVEKNGKVLKQEWITTTGNICSYKIKLQPSMAPNIYVHVSLIQEHAQTKNSLPLRMYGITPVMIENKNSRINPVIKAAEAFEPNSKAQFTISEEKGRAMTYTVAVVDEGLLGLTAFSTADPWNTFYKKESSQLLSWDIYDSVIGASNRKIESLLTVGGGGGVDRSGGKNAERFKPVVFFFGPYELKANEKKQIEFDMPQYIGAVRIMTIAGKDGAYGISEKSVKVKSDLIVMPTLPRTIGVDETIQIPVTVFNGTSSEKNASVSLKSKGSIQISDEKKIKVPANGDSSVIFEIKTNKPGIAEFGFEASASGITKKAKAFTEIDVLSRGTPYTAIENVNVSSGKNWSKIIKINGEAGTKQLKVEISQFPALGLENRIAYLLQYPYGCIEQITSRGFPQIYLPQMVNLDSSDIEKTKTNVNSVLERYPSYQLRSGAFSYWPGGGYENSWATNYAGHFMVEAKKAGYEVNDSVYNAWFNYQTEKAVNWASSYEDSIEDQAYRLYTLALAGKPEIGAMNRLKTTEANLNHVSTAFLANAYALAGHLKTAKILLEKVTVPASAYRHTGRNFSSDIRDLAVILNAYTTCGIQDKAAPIVRKLAAVSSSPVWLSTQETAWLLFSLSPHYAFDKTKKVEFEIQTETHIIKDSLLSASKIYQIPINDEENVKKIEIRNTGKIPLYAAITTQGRLKPGDESSQSGNLDIRVQYINSEGENISPEDLKLGDRFKIKVTVSNNTINDVDNIALSMPVPTGWEITNPRIGLSDDDEPQNYEYQDLRDTHVYTHFNLREHSAETLEFAGTVTYGGSYYLPAITAEAMYDDAYKAVLRGQTINAKRKEN